MAESLTLGELIANLEAADLTMVVPDGFQMPHSYRGYYNDVAFEPARNVTVAHMLGAAREALGSTYEGWKGGHYTMAEGTDCWLAFEGACGSELSLQRLRDMLAAGHGQDGQAAEVERLRAELADANRFLDQRRNDVAAWRDSYERLSRQVLRRHHAWQSARRGRKQAREQVKAARPYIDWLHEQRRAQWKEMDRLAEQVKRVRDRHYPVCSGACNLADACECEERDLICAEDNDRWPCPTRRDLDGTEAAT